MAEEASTTPASPPLPVQKSALTPFPTTLSHEWYQTSDQVVLSLFIKNVPSSTVKPDFQPRSLSILFSLPHSANAEGSFDLEPLSHEVVVEGCGFQVFGTKIEVKLEKKAKGVKWGKLEGEDGGEQMNAASTKSAPTYPSSSRKKTNWDAVAKKADEEDYDPSQNKDPNAGGDKDVNLLFKKLYAGATDEQRMAMEKSYQESNGTALSTDWKDVGSRTVLTHPPDTMKEVKW